MLHLCMKEATICHSVDSWFHPVSVFENINDETSKDCVVLCCIVLFCYGLG